MSDQEMRCLILPATGCRMLLPETSMEEIISVQAPEPIKDAPPWIVGALRWQHWHLPVASWAQLMERAESEPVDNAMAAVVKALGGPNRMPYFGILCQQPPVMVTVTADQIEPVDSGSRLGLLATVSIDGNQLLIPDLERTTQLVAHAAYGTLPMTMHGVGELGRSAQ